MSGSVASEPGFRRFVAARVGNTARVKDPGEDVCIISYYISICIYMYYIYICIYYISMCIIFIYVMDYIMVLYYTKLYYML
jgi:hypothetical protein